MQQNEMRTARPDFRGSRHRRSRAATACLLLILLSISIFSAPQSLLALSGDLPEGTLTTPPLVKEESVSTYVASESAPGDGIAVNIIVPEKPRYADGAPVVVVAPGGDDPNGLTFTMHAAQIGCLEVRLAFPGGGVKGFMSSGIADYRGLESQEAFRDVLLFAAGKTTDTKGHHISDLVPMKVSGTNIGVVGWSNGGNIALITMAKFAEQLQFISWLALYESPVGLWFFPANLGGVNELLLNDHYRQGSAASGAPIVDLNNLCWQDDAVRYPGMHKLKGEPETKGVIFYDDNKNHHWDESSEYAFNYLLDVGLEKQIYPPQILQEFERRKAFSAIVEIKDRRARPEKPQKLKRGEKPKPKPVLTKRVVMWPKQLAQPKESDAYYHERDGSYYLKDVVSKFPDLLVMLVATQLDHMQKQPDHPHIAYLYNAFLSNKVHWLKLNPDPVYLNYLTQMHTANFVKNKANEPIDAVTIAEFLEPEGVTRDYIFVDAAIAELSDRRRSKNLKGPLADVLFQYRNSKFKPPQTKPKSDSTSSQESPQNETGAAGARQTDSPVP